MNINIFIALIFLVFPIVYQITQTIRRLKNKTRQSIASIYLMTISVGVIFSLISTYFFVTGLMNNKSNEPRCITGIEATPIILILIVFVLASLIGLIGGVIKYFYH